MAFTTLAHHLDVPFLERAFDRLNRHSAAGIDRVTWQAYEEDLIPKLEDLHATISRTGNTNLNRLSDNGFPKAMGSFVLSDFPLSKTRSSSVRWRTCWKASTSRTFTSSAMAFVQVAMRTKRYAILRQGLQSRIHYVIDCDISAFFDNLQHDELLAILRKRVKDGRVLELIESWLKAGIMDGKDLVFPEKGSPQGSVISPLLANVYLHEVLDTWFAEVVTAHCRGKVVMYRYADDFVIGCELESDAERIMKALPQRFAKYGLEINEEKTRMISFRRPPRRLLTTNAWPETRHV